MSFSSDVKEELARVIPEQMCCRKAELVGLFKACGSMTIGRSGTSLSVSVENASVARKAFSYLKEIYRLTPQIVVQQQRRLRVGNVYVVGVDSLKAVASLIKDLGVIEPEEALLRKISGPQGASCCAKSLLRGLFLGSGSVTAPGRGHHLEVVLNDSPTAEQVIRVFGRFGMVLKAASRKHKFIVYSKQAQDIADVLNLLGAHSSLMRYEDVRAYKTIKSRVNRIVNMETANLTKVARAASKQAEDIRLIESRIGLSALPGNLEEIARLRLSHPDASLSELGQMLPAPLTKSGINHRMRRIAGIADDLRERAAREKR